MTNISNNLVKICKSNRHSHPAITEKRIKRTSKALLSLDFSQPKPPLSVPTWPSAIPQLDHKFVISHISLKEANNFLINLHEMLCAPKSLFDRLRHLRTCCATQDPEIDKVIRHRRSEIVLWVLDDEARVQRLSELCFWANRCANGQRHAISTWSAPETSACRATHAHHL